MIAGKTLIECLEKLELGNNIFNITEPKIKTTKKLFSQKEATIISLKLKILIEKINNFDPHKNKLLKDLIINFNQKDNLSYFERLLLLIIESIFFSIPNNMESKIRDGYKSDYKNTSILVGICLFLFEIGYFNIGFTILVNTMQDDYISFSDKTKIIQKLINAVNEKSFINKNNYFLSLNQEIEIYKLFCEIIHNLSKDRNKLNFSLDDFLKNNEKIAENIKFESLKKLETHFQYLISAKKYLTIATSLKKLFDSKKLIKKEYLELKNLLLKKIYLSFVPIYASEEAPRNYSEINYLLSKYNYYGDYTVNLKSISLLNEETPLVIIKNISDLDIYHNSKYYWIANGNVRSGSTLIYNLLRILGSSLTNNYISAWEGDLNKPQKFFQIVEENKNLNLGILKIHKFDPEVENKLLYDHAKAIFTHRNLLDASLSFWRMSSLISSPFYNKNLKLSFLDNFINNQIKEFKLKGKSPNTLIIKEKEISHYLGEVIKKVCIFLSIEIESISSKNLINFLSKQNLIKLSSNKYLTKNSTGHQKITFLHAEHISEVPYESPIYDEVKSFTLDLLRNKYSKDITDDFYIKNI